MAYNCGLRIFTECIQNSSASATQSGTINGRPQYIFTFISVTNVTVNGRIYWNQNDNRWYAEDTDTDTIISYLPYDRVHPYGTVLEWENYGLLSYGCLSNSSSFYTTWLSDCPPSYFQFCCPREIQPDNYFGLQNFEYFQYYDSVFYLETPQFSGCATVIEGPIPTNSIIYNSASYVTQYERCIECTASTLSCFYQPVFPEPTPTPLLTANTECGTVYTLVNECEPITILPLSAICLVTNVSTYGGNNGVIELLITGGTPPYIISWNNGNTTPILTNLSAGTYGYSIVDYYGDFIYSSQCVVNQASQPVPTPPLQNICLFVQVEDQIDFETLVVVESTTGGKPFYTGGGYDIIWSDDFSPPRWFMEGPLTAGDMVNYNPNYPPLTGWTWLNSTYATTTVSVGNCQSYGNFCMTLNIDSLSPNPYRIYFQQSQNVNSQPSWVDLTNTYSITWNSNQTSQTPYWVLNGISEEYSFVVLNYSSSLPPINGWRLQGAQGDVTTNQGFCFSETICATITNLCGTESIELSSGDFINGQQSWNGILPCETPGDNWFIFYNNITNVWSTSGLTNVPGILSEAILNTDSYTGPFGEFSSDYFGLFVYDGECGTQGALSMSVTTNNPVSENDGSIIVEANGGSLPYQYSINNGTTFQNFPIFTNLVFGTYVVTVKDSLGAIIRETVVLQIPNNRTSYQVYLNTTSRKTVESVTTNTTEYTTSVRVSPTLPSGTTITFDISHTDLYKVSPTQTASTLTIGSILIKNGEEISIFDTNTSTTNVTNTNAGCQNNLIYTTATTENWNGISMSYNDDIKIITSVSNYKPQNVPCYFVQNTESYSLSNLSITGCTNCEVVNQENT